MSKCFFLDAWWRFCKLVYGFAVVKQLEYAAITEHKDKTWYLVLQLNSMLSVP